MIHNTARVTIRHRSKLAGALGISDEHNDRRTIELPSPFTYAEAKEAARCALYYAQDDSPAYESVQVRSVAFN